MRALIFVISLWAARVLLAQAPQCPAGWTLVNGQCVQQGSGGGGSGIPPTVTGMVKATAGVASTAVDGTDYVSPTALNNSTLPGAFTTVKIGGVTSQCLQVNSSGQIVGAGGVCNTGSGLGTITGLVKAASGTPSAAIDGTDYVSPTTLGNQSLSANFSALTTLNDVNPGANLNATGNVIAGSNGVGVATAIYNSGGGFTGTNGVCTFTIPAPTGGTTAQLTYTVTGGVVPTAGTPLVVTQAGTRYQSVPTTIAVPVSGSGVCSTTANITVTMTPGCAHLYDGAFKDSGWCGNPAGQSGSGVILNLPVNPPSAGQMMGNDGANNTLWQYAPYGAVQQFSGTGANNITDPVNLAICNANLNAVTITLPAATKTLRYITMKKVDTSANTCTLQAAGSDTIDTAAAGGSIVISTQWGTATVVDGGASGKWYRVAIPAMGGDLSGISINSTVNAIGGKTVTLGGPLTTVGNFTTAGSGNTTFTTSGNTNVTLPPGAYNLSNIGTFLTGFCYGTVNAAAGTYWLAPTGNTGVSCGSGNTAPDGIPMPQGCTAQNLFASVASHNTGTSAVQITVLRNGSTTGGTGSGPGPLQCTIPIGGTSCPQDTTDLLVFSAGDFWSVTYQVTAASDTAAGIKVSFQCK